jgi:hypothetical protein
MTSQLPPIADISLPASIPEDSHWWLWSQSTRRVNPNRPAGALNFPYSQSFRLAFYF